ncbi:MAG: multidrug effflux MFS transporter [Myxococcota bacterium]|nr:multidrug effflux MFS transporter [Myxococcota bacterium]
MPSKPELKGALLLTLALLSAAAPFATDLYLPGFPTMMESLGASASTVQLSLTAFLVGAGVGQAFFGPLSDRIGRRGPLLVGTVLFLLSSIAAALAPTAGWLIAARAAQGLSGAAGMVIGRTVVSDLSRGASAASAFSKLMMVVGVAPVLAPIAGSLLVEPLGWRGLLWVIAGIGGVIALAVIRFVPETHGPQVRAEAGPPPTLQELKDILGTRAFLGAAGTYVLTFAALMAYISASPFLYQGLMGLSPVQYALAFGLNALSLMVMGGVTSKLTQRVKPARLARLGLTLHLLAVSAFVVMALADLNPLLFGLPILLAAAASGMVFGTTTAMALDAAHKVNGYASAVLGLCQFVLAGAVAPLVGLGGEGTALPLALTMAAASALANLAFTRLRKGSKHPRRWAARLRPASSRS